MDTLEGEGIAVVTITHDMEFVARNFKRVVAMAHRNIIADGTAEEVFGDHAVLEDAKIRKPQICELAERLGLGSDILTCEQLVEALRKEG